LKTFDAIGLHVEPAQKVGANTVGRSLDKMSVQICKFVHKDANLCESAHFAKCSADATIELVT